MVRQRSWVWTFTELTTDGKETICKLCDARLVYCGSSSAIANHLKNISKKNSTDGNIDEADRSNVESSNSVSTLTTPMNNKRTKKRKRCGDTQKQCKPEKQEAISQATAKLIACGMLPISLVSSDAFKEFMAVLEPDYKVPCAETIKTRLQFLYAEVRKKIENLLSLTSNISLTIDEWSSRAQNSYLSIEAQFFYNKKEMHHVTLCNEEMEDNPTAQNIADLVVIAIGDWGLDGKVQAVVHDSAAAMVAAGRFLSDIPDSLNCAAHLLQLVVKNSIDAVPAYGEILVKGRTVSKHFKQSNIASRELTGRQNQLNLPKEKLISYCLTRWDSDFYMCESLLRNRSAITLVLADRKVTKPGIAKNLEFVESDWATMEEMVKLLKPFQLATTVLCSENKPTLSMVRPIIKGIMDKHMAISLSENDNTRFFKEAARCSLERRFETNDVTAYQLAQFFDPRYKSLEAEDEKFKAITHRYIQRMLEGNDSDNEENNIVQETALDFLFQAETNKQDSSHQFHLYVSEAQISHNLDPIIWWINHKEKYPALYKLALKYLSIPATSAMSERTFSTAGNIITAKRSCLSPENVNLLTFLYQNRSFMQ